MKVAYTETRNMSGSEDPEPEEYAGEATAKMPPTVSPQDAYNWLANDFVNNYLKVTKNSGEHCDFCAQTAGQGFSVGAAFKKRITLELHHSNKAATLYYSKPQEQIWTIQECDAMFCRVVFKVENVTAKASGKASVKCIEDTIVSISFNEDEIQTSWIQVVHHDKYVLAVTDPYWLSCCMLVLCPICAPWIIPNFCPLYCTGIESNCYCTSCNDHRKRFHDESLNNAISVCAKLKRKLQDALDDGTLRTLVSVMPIATTSTASTHVVDVVTPKEIEMSRMTKDQAETELVELKRFLDLGIITQDDHDKKAVSLKRTLLGN